MSQCFVLCHLDPRCSADSIKTKPQALYQKVSIMESCGEEVMNAMSPSSPKFLTYNEIAKKLLNEKLLLTALELHAELCEAGKELPVLRDFFSNPGNFEGQNVKTDLYVSMPRSSSQVTLDSLDMTRYSEDGGIDERVAVLEFELRKARENIFALRENLTVVTESEAATPDKNSERNSAVDVPIKPHEQRALNFLVYEYLLARSYKLTSITFSDENENQDFEDWEDVGLNIPKPPDLVQVYRDFLRGNGYEKPPSHEIGIQTDIDEEPLKINESQTEKPQEDTSHLLEELQSLKDQVDSLERVKIDLENRLESYNSSMNSGELVGPSQTHKTVSCSSSTTPDKFEILEPPARDTSEATCNQDNEEEEDSISVVASLGDTDPGDKDWTRVHIPRMDVTIDTPTLSNSPSRLLPFKFKREVLAHCLTSSPIIDGTQESLLDITTLTLPKIVPNIILTKREESIPLILNTIRLHGISSEREKLIHLLFNLKKRPQEEERRILLGGLTAIAKVEDAPPTPEEILNICWEQSQHKYPEKRILAAECCSALAPFSSSGVRNSLMLSMLQQMLLEDKDPMVRISVVRSLALLVALMDDPEKYFQCEELALTALDDGNFGVFDAASNFLFPILAQWALSLNRLQSHLLPRILSKLKSQLKPQHSPNRDHHREIEKTKFSITILQILLPHLIVCIASSPTVAAAVEENTPSEIPREILALCRTPISNPQIFSDDNQDVGILLNTFIKNSWDNETWQEFVWLDSKLLPDVLEMVKSIEIHQEKMLNALLNYIYSLCSGFGQHVTTNKMKKSFELEVKDFEQRLINSPADQPPSMNLALIPAYLTILSTLDPTEMSKALKHFVVLISVTGSDVICLSVSVKRLVKNSQIVEQVLTTLWDGVVHQKPIVRSITAKLFAGIIGNVNERLVTSRIAPAIVTLASDSDLMVKSSAISALGKLITECGAREAKDKGRLTLETIARDPQGIPPALSVPLVMTFAHIAPHCPQYYLEDIIATQLTGITASVLQENRRTDIVGALLDAFSILVYCSLSVKCVSGVLLPGLRHLENLVSQIIPQQKDNIKSLIREAESKLNNVKPIERSTSASSGLSLSLATANVGQGVEDMRQRMSKIFTQKPNSPGLQSIFRKK